MSFKALFIQPVIITVSVGILCCDVVKSTHPSSRRTRQVSAQTPVKHTTSLTTSLYCGGARRPDGLATQRPLTFQPSEEQGRGLCPAVFSVPKCSAKIDAGCLSQPDAVSKETMTDFLGYTRYFSLNSADSFRP